jgi:hypothetical protein
MSDSRCWSGSWIGCSPLDAVTTDLETAGIASFCDSYHSLLACLNEQAEHLGF